MKKLSLFILGFILFFALLGCKPEESAPNIPTTEVPVTEELNYLDMINPIWGNYVIEASLIHELNIDDIKKVTFIGMHFFIDDVFMGTQIDDGTRLSLAMFVEFNDNTNHQNHVFNFLFSSYSDIRESYDIALSTNLEDSKNQKRLLVQADYNQFVDSITTVMTEQSTFLHQYIEKTFLMEELLSYVPEVSMVEENGILYLLYHDYAVLVGPGTSFDTNLETLTIPGLAQNREVREIRLDAFASQKLKSITIPTSILKIGYGAFRNNQIENITILGNEVRFNNDWENIGFPLDLKSPIATYNGFSFNVELQSIVKYEGNNRDIVIPSMIYGIHVTTIGASAFKNNTLKSVVIPDSVTTIGEFAFSVNQLTSVVIPDSVISIGEFAFNNNRLTSVVIPSGVTTIAKSTFFQNQLTNVVIPAGVTSIGELAFSNNLLTTIVIPDSVTTIGNRAFYANELSSVVIPNSVITIEEGAFRFNQLTSIIIPESVTTIGEIAFSLNPITSVTIEGDETRFNDNWLQIGFPIDFRPGLVEFEGFLFDSSLNEIQGYKGASKDIILPSEINGIPVTKIGNLAFRYKQLTSVVIPNSVTYIGDEAFRDNLLTNVVIPNSVISIGELAFSGNQITSIIIPNSVTHTGDSAFMNNQITSVIIPNSVTHIGHGAFMNNQITSIIIPNSVTHIGNGAFMNNQITSIIIPSSVTDLGYQAFMNNQITSVIIPDSIKTISHQVFTNNPITSITVLGNEKYFNNIWDEIGFPSDLKPE